jgi:type IV pilus assembly protein PilE
MIAYKRKIHGNGPGAGGGFTLLELMIVVVIVGVLAALAYPSYQQYARESKRTDAHAALLRIATLQEKFFSNSIPPAYTTNATALGYAADPAASHEGYWAISITGTPALTPMSFTLTAVPAGSHQDPECGAGITLTSAGLRGGPAANCW